MKLKSILYLLGSLGLLQACSQQSLEKELDSMYTGAVPLIQPEALEKWTKMAKPLVILDTRSISEYGVSHLKDAKFVDFETFDSSMVADLDKSSTVVVYCSVGYRSERVGERMKALGFVDVHNLYGGIFNWKNQGHAVVNNHNQPTDSVHAYNKLWGQWLKKGIKVYD